MQSLKPIIYFFREGMISSAEQKCIASFDRFGHEIKILNVNAILSNGQLKVPRPFHRTVAALRDLSDDAKPAERAALCSALSNWSKWIIGAAPATLDSAQFRIFPDTDYFAFTDPATWLDYGDDITAFIASHAGTRLSALIALMGATPAHPFFVETLECAPGWAMCNPHVPLPLQAGSPLLIQSLVAQQPQDVRLAPHADFAAYTGAHREERKTPSSLAVEGVLQGVKALHGWFRSYQEGDQKGQQTLTNDEVVAGFERLSADNQLTADN